MYSGLYLCSMGLGNATLCCHKSSSNENFDVLEMVAVRLSMHLYVQVIYVYLQKAFDKVPHKRLLEKCRLYGFTEQVMSWLDKFPAGRKQRVLLNGISSQWEDVKSGFPQGSVPGPLLFLIFINDLPEAVRSTIYLFADDSKIWQTIKDKEDSEILQQDLDKMQNGVKNGSCSTIQIN